MTYPADDYRIAWERCASEFSSRDELQAHIESSHPGWEPVSERDLRADRPDLALSHSFLYDNRGDLWPQYEKVQEYIPRQVSTTDLKTWMAFSQPEIVVVLEAVDPVTGSNFQVREGQSLVHA